MVSELSRHCRIDFLGFNHLYPESLFPGKLKDESTSLLEENENLKIRNTLNWYNPIGWIIEAFKIRTDVIHAQWWSFPLAPIYLTILGINRLRKKKIILTIHNILPHERSLLKTLLHKSVYSLGDIYIVHTNKNEQILRKFVKNKPIHIIPHGLIINPTKNIDKNLARQTLGFSREDKILLCFGHIRKYKGIDTALKALNLIKDPSVKLLIAGKCWIPWEKYQKIIDDLKLQDRVICKLGFIAADEIDLIFKSSDLVLLPYRHFDAQSGVGALILPYGIPLVVSNTGGLTDYVKSDTCIVQQDNPEELGEKIQFIFNDPVLYEQLKKDILETKKGLDWETIVPRVAMLY